MESLALSCMADKFVDNCEYQEESIHVLRIIKLAEIRTFFLNLNIVGLEYLLIISCISVVIGADLLLCFVWLSFWYFSCMGDQ